MERESGMLFSDIADEQLTNLRKVLDDYCREAGIAPSTPERAHAGRIIMALFSNGICAAGELRAALAASLAGKPLPYEQGTQPSNKTERTMSIQNMNDLFLHSLKDIYFAENQILKALPKMSEKATSSDLSDAFDAHLAETEEHVTRLKQVFELIGQEPQGEECPAIEAIMEEAEKLMGEIEQANTLDAALIAAAQTVEHYEITRYGTLAAWAGELGLDEAAEVLNETLEEERAADRKLTDLGESRINAASVEDEGDEGDSTAAG
jgi:ferritin-like metal-binding protein YciE